MSTEVEPLRQTPAPDGARLVGRRLGPYEVLDEVGRGGMSVVYRGRDTRLDREVAIKVLHPFLADRDDARRRFEREARAVASLQHPNILEIYDFSDDAAEQSYIVTELVRGVTLRVFVEQQPLDPPELAAVIGIKLCAALQRAHAAGVVHRDVKPENIMIGEAGALKLMDFGIAHMRDATSLTATGTLLGSPAHMAPEAIEGGTIDERTDQFSVGTILYWMASGKLPFTGKNPHALLKRIVDGKYTPPQRVNPKISDRLAEIIGRTLACEPAARFPDVGVLREALLAVLREGGIVDVDETLARYCADPARAGAVLTTTVVSAFTQRAREAQREGETAKALAAFNRVLALDPGNTRARDELDGLMRRLQRTALLARLRRGGLVASVVVVLLAVASWGLVQLGGAQPAADPVGAADPQATTSQLAATTLAGSGASLRSDPTAGSSEDPDPAPGPVAHKRPQVTSAGGQTTVPVAPNKVMTARQAREKAQQEPGPTALDPTHEPGVELREVPLHIHPWADVYVDDAERPAVKGAKQATLQLAPGTHRLRFENTFTAPEEFVVEVARSGPVSIPRVQMHRMRPAYLVVDAPAEAEVKVAGKYWGKVAATRSAPIIVPLPDGMPRVQHVVEITLAGHQPFVAETAFTAGETQQLHAVLVPLAAAPAPANTP
ncbi:MAG: protein kinase [Pseudomonadota bacterium]